MMFALGVVAMFLFGFLGGLAFCLVFMWGTKADRLALQEESRVLKFHQ